MRCPAKEHDGAARAKEVLKKDNRSSARPRTFVWVTFGVMGLSTFALLYTLAFQHSGQ